MRGVVFAALEDFVVDRCGSTVYDEVLRTANLPEGRIYHECETYPDDELYALIAGACQHVSISPDSALHSVGHFVFHRLAIRAGERMVGYSDLRGFLDSLGDIITRETDLGSGKLVTDLMVIEIAANVVILEFQSSQILCVLLRGVIAAAADYFRVRTIIEELECQRYGAQKCRLAIVFRGKPAKSP